MYPYKWLKGLYMQCQSEHNEVQTLAIVSVLNHTSIKICKLFYVTFAKKKI